LGNRWKGCKKEKEWGKVRGEKKKKKNRTPKIAGKGGWERNALVTSGSVGKRLQKTNLCPRASPRREAVSMGSIRINTTGKKGGTNMALHIAKEVVGSPFGNLLVPRPGEGGSRGKGKIVNL